MTLILDPPVFADQAFVPVSDDAGPVEGHDEAPIP
jgi:hypothetical protein